MKIGKGGKSSGGFDMNVFVQIYQTGMYSWILLWFNISNLIGDRRNDIVGAKSVLSNAIYLVQCNWTLQMLSFEFPSFQILITWILFLIYIECLKLLLAYCDEFRLEKS